MNVYFTRDNAVNKPKEATPYLPEIVEYALAHHAFDYALMKHR